MRKYLLYCLFTILPISTYAQLTDGSVAPDFTVQDLNGNTWRLYDLLDQGKNVFLDLSATWCPPCWSYHNSGAMNQAYTSYGPEGTDEFMLFMIEIDPNTELECLYGISPCSKDWTEGALYPIINDDFIGDAYAITFVPTHYHICPNRLVTLLHHPSAEEIYAMKGKCVEASGNNNASVAEYLSFEGTFCGSMTMAPAIKVQNLGHEPMVSLTAELYVNDVLQETIQWSGHINTFATFFLSFDSITVVEDASVMIRITSVNGVADEDVSNNETVVQLTSLEEEEENLLQLELTTGVFPEYVFWKLLNSDSTLLYKGGNAEWYGYDIDSSSIYLTHDSTYIISLPLPGDGCYSFIIYDGIGGGYGVSHYRITDPHGKIMAEDSSISNFNQHLIGIANAADPVFANGAITRIDGFEDEFCRLPSYTPRLELLNLGTEFMTDAEIELLEDGHLLHVVEWTGHVLPGGFANIDIPATYFTTGENILVRIRSINGIADTFPYLNEWHADLKRNISGSHAITMELQLDWYAYAVYWQLTNTNGEVLYSGGNTKVGPDGSEPELLAWDDPGAYFSNAYVKVDMLLPDTINDCYQLLIVDAFSDGIANGGYIKFKETYNGKEVMSKLYDWSPFATDEILLEVNPKGTSTETLIDIDDFVLYPNPAQAEIQVRFETARTLPITLSIINLLGETCIHLPETTYSAGAGNISIDVSGLTPGVYILQLVSGNEYLTQKLSVMK